MSASVAVAPPLCDAADNSEGVRPNVQHFLLSLSTVILVDVDGRFEVEALPAGEIVGLERGQQPADKFIDVLWQGKRVRMFAVDLQQRGILVPPTT